MRTVRLYVCSAFAIIYDTHRRFSLGASRLDGGAWLICVKCTEMESPESAVTAFVASPGAGDVGDNAAVHETPLARVQTHDGCVLGARLDHLTFCDFLLDSAQVTTERTGSHEPNRGGDDHPQGTERAPFA